MQIVCFSHFLPSLLCFIFNVIIIFSTAYSFGIVLFELITTTPLKHITDRYTKTPTITMATNPSPLQTKLIELYQSLTCLHPESRPLPPAILQQFNAMSEELV